MKKILLTVTLATVAVGAQTIDSTAPRSTTERPNVSAPGLEKTMTGVLMDASCSAVARQRVDPSLTSVGRLGPVEQNGVTGANEQSTQGATARTLTELEKAESIRATDRTEADAANNPGTNPPRLTESEQTRARTVKGSMPTGPDRASAVGTTGAAVEAPVPQSGNLQDSDRDLNLRPRSDVEVVPTVRTKYRDCMVRPATTSFALHADGELYVMDRISNQMMQEQMRNEAFHAALTDSKDKPRWVTVTATGVTTSDNTLTLRKVRK